MNNALTEIKSTLEGTNSRIAEAEERISEVENRMVEINETGRKTGIRIKRNETNSETSGTMLNAQHSNHRSPRRRRHKERA